MADKNYKQIPARFDKQLGLLAYISTMGFMIGLNVTVRGPEYFVSTYPEGWQEEYEARNYMFIDPMMYWSMTRTGTCRWSESAINRASPIFKRAKSHDLCFGATLATIVGGRRSLLSIARSDREFEDSELEICMQILEDLAQSAFEGKISIEEIETLRLAADGYSQKEIAFELGVAEPTVKLRLSRVKEKLNARNTTHAVRIAISEKLI
ncbi:MAG: helix-turn-helix transcriptional regulator [Paracoccaceae bacterium]